MCVAYTFTNNFINGVMNVELYLHNEVSSTAEAPSKSVQNWILY